jgi:alpha-methylacyl-CoA racemase
LIYADMTGWGQDGPLAGAAGHDINYIALAGALHGIGRRGQGPVPPINLVGDFGGGGMLLVIGVLSALVERSVSGQGQVVDVAMVDGAALLTTSLYGPRASGQWKDERGTNSIDTGSHFYDAYETADGEYVTIGSIEPQFYAELIERLHLVSEDLPPQNDRQSWPSMKERFRELFRQRSRAEWCDLLEGTDVCFAPVLSLAEAPHHPHNVHRKTFLELEGIVQPAPAPRFSRTPGEVARPPAHAGQHTDEILDEWLGADADRIAKLRETGAIA